MSICSPGAFAIVLGPSTPSSVLFGRGVSVISAVVADETAVLRGLSRGGHSRQ
ncbi:MAG: Rossmann-like domain-containing protein [Myxococcales bacterium]